MRGRSIIATAAAATLIAAAVAVAQTAPDGQAAPADQLRRLEDAKAQSAAAAARSAALETAASREKDAAAQARVQEAAVAARVQQAQADIAAGQARAAITARLLADQRERLATQQGPIARLIAALQSLARRPALISLVQPGSVDDLVHVRAVLASAMPVVRTRTAALRADLDRTRALQASATLAAVALGESRTRLEVQRLALTRLEAGHRLKSQALGRDALVESDRAIALGERARDIVDLMSKLDDQTATRASLAALPGPLPRPPRAGEIVSTLDTPSWPSASPPYRLPVAGTLVTGLGEVSDAGVRSRGLTIATQADAPVIAPAAGRVAYAGRFRSYGVIVILDHGGGWTTLVSGLGAASVAAGAQVAQGAAIGSAAKGDDPRVTVELRRRDRAVDMVPLIG